MGLLNKLLGGKGQELPKKAIIEKNAVYAPVDGELIALEDFPDEVFLEGILGPGCGIVPKGEVVRAPFDGTIIALQDTGHAVGMKSGDGVELLIHVGIDTVGLNGKGFTPRVKTGDTVVKGQELLEFSLETIHAAGLVSTVAVTVPNAALFQSVKTAEPGTVDNNTVIITLE